ncbi:uncharacterized protein LOC130590295 [Beta vulgaris subsp. vulgaris]|uniref:uncharacterized protein LOC130590295 n=1 Tax=Beta vulgaris subsp. vulgaris TaxID=3555 RepID=UPI002549324F|nr:uncharacterized protein LOC130590295 [Beta vulgaris subsp. vulgaris]
MPGEEGEASTSGRLAYPEIDPKGGPGAKFPLPSLIKALLEDARGQAAKFQIKDPYLLVRPDASHTILSPPPGCTAFYYKAMEMGLRFPLTQFEKDILNAYNLCLGQLSPNSWGGILAVQVICDIIRVKPTLTLCAPFTSCSRCPPGIMDLVGGASRLGEATEPSSTYPLAKGVSSRSFFVLFEGKTKNGRATDFRCSQGRSDQGRDEGNKINKPSKPKDPSNPKPRKRKERAEERVELTEKALAKARAEKEASAKKARKEPSVEVNSPRPDSGGGDTHISVHPSDFEPVRSPGHAQGTSNPSLAERSLSEAPVPFTQMSKTDKKKRISDALEILCTQTDRDHINEVNGRNESSELFRSWMDFSIRMTKVAEDRLALVQEVQELKDAARSHFDELYQAREDKRLAELRKEEVEDKIRKGEEAWQKEQEEWKVERANLSLAKENAESAKATAETNLAKVEGDLERVKFKLSTAEAQLKEAHAAVARSQEEWFMAWQASDDCTEFCAEVGQSSHKMGEDEALGKLREALADSCPEADWNSVWSRYQEIVDAEAAVIKAKMAEEMSSDDEDEDDDDEGAASIEPPPGNAAEQPDAEDPAADPAADRTPQLPYGFFYVFAMLAFCFSFCIAFDPVFFVNSWLYFATFHQLEYNYYFATCLVSHFFVTCNITTFNRQ